MAGTMILTVLHINKPVLDDQCKNLVRQHRG